MAILKGPRMLSRHEPVKPPVPGSPKLDPMARNVHLLPKTPLSPLLAELPVQQCRDAQQDRLIQSLLKLFKRLEVAVGKFEGKLAGITKTNVLRTVVLPFLRLLSPLHTYFDPGSKIYLSFASILTAVLGLWWRLLLTCLNATGPLQVSATDRSAYLECVSRIIARREWIHADSQSTATYMACLSDTLDFSITRLLSFKVVPVSVAAFVGKVFAYSYFHLPGVCNALLFLLNVKQKTVDRLAPALSPLTQASRDAARELFPRPVAHMVDYAGIQRLERAKRTVINCVVPPKHPVRGIRDPAGPWVRRWCASDSDIFTSFFRHYISIAHLFVGDSTLVGPEAFPGFRVLASYIYQIISVSVNRILQAKGPATGMAVSPQQKLGQANGSTTGSGLPPSSLSFKQSDSNYTSITKLFRSVRDINYSLVPFASKLTKIIDLLLVHVAKHIGLYDVNKSSLLLNLVYEYSIHVFDASDMNWEFWLSCNHLMLTNTYHVQIISRSFAFLFNVWDKIPNLLSDGDVTKEQTWLTDSTESLKANFSNWLTSSAAWQVYFTHWNPLVRSHYLRLLVWRVIGANNFETSCSINTTRRVKQKTDYIFENLCKILACENLPTSLASLDFAPDLPIVNRKFGIVPINNKYSYMDEITSLISVATISKPSDLRKTHPYEILDEAVYTCTSLPSSPGVSLVASSDSIAQQKSMGNHSLINSLSRFFKMLSTDEPPENDSLDTAPAKKMTGNRTESGVPARGRNFTKSPSLSAALSMKSVSSSPSLASFQSSPESLNDKSTESSVTSDSDSSLSDRFGSSSTSTFSSSNSSSNMQPPELIKIPPEIVRPIFKLDIVLDHELASLKYSRMQESKSSWNGRVFYGSRKERNISYLTLPKPPKIPSVSIFLNSDAYNKFFITRETYQIGGEALDVSDIEDFNAFIESMACMLDNQSDLTLLGKALNEWNGIVDEFESYLFEKVEADQANYLPITSVDSELEVRTSNEINEVDYFTRIIPFLPIDNLTELKLLNAS